MLTGFYRAVTLLTRTIRVNTMPTENYRVLQMLLDAIPIVGKHQLSLSYLGWLFENLVVTHQRRAPV